jgi:argininosuccinate synthase
MLQAAIDQTQAVVNGEVRLKFYKGNVIVVGRQSDNSLFSEKIATKTIWLQQMAIHNLLKNQQGLKSIPLFSMLNHHIPSLSMVGGLY